MVYAQPHYTNTDAAQERPRQGRALGNEVAEDGTGRTEGTPLSGRLNGLGIKSRKLDAKAEQECPAYR